MSCIIIRIKRKHFTIISKNKVQFQNGLSIPAYFQSYGEEQQCEDALFAARWPQGPECPACGRDSFCRLGCHRAVFQCNGYKRQVSLLAGTIFESTKLPLTVWFLALHLLSQARNGSSALELGRQIGVSRDTAWLLRHKPMQVMLEREAGRKLEGEVQVDDACLGGERAGQLRRAGPGLGQHGPGEREALAGRNLPAAAAEVRGALPGGVPVPLQPALRPGGAAAAAAAATLPLPRPMLELHPYGC